MISPEGLGVKAKTWVYVRLLRVGGQVLAVVAGPLLVAEGLEALLEPLVEGLVELLRAACGTPAGRCRRAAAHDVLAEGVEELADAFLAVAGLDELEGGVAQVVDQARVARLAEVVMREMRGIWSVTAASRTDMRSSGSQMPRM